MLSPSSGALPLPFAEPDRPLICVEVTGGHGVRQRLTDMGILPGTPVKLLVTPGAAGPLVIDVRGTRLALGRGMAQRILVSPA